MLLAPMPTKRARLVVLFVTFCLCTRATAAMYRWVDENGVTVYSQSPGPNGESIGLKNQPAPRAEDAQAARERTRQQRERALDEGEARQETKTERSKKVGEEKLRAANCEAARNNLYSYQNLGRRMVRTADGRYLRLSEDEIGTQIEKARMQVNEFCN